MTNLKCPNCGADITDDQAQSSGKCIYCGSRFASKKVEKQEPPQQLYIPPVNEKHHKESKKPNRRRPRLKPFLLFVFFFMGPVFFVGYIVLTEIRKREYDKEFLN